MSFTLQVISGKYCTNHGYNECLIEIAKSHNSVNQKVRIFIIKADWKYQRSLRLYKPTKYYNNENRPNQYQLHTLLLKKQNEY